jgi:hypothetical protein
MNQETTLGLWIKNPGAKYLVTQSLKSKQTMKFLKGFSTLLHDWDTKKFFGAKCQPLNMKTNGIF